MHVAPILHEEVFILPVVARDQMSTGLAPAGTPHRKAWVGLHQAVVIRQFFSLPNIAGRNEITVVVETAIPLAGVIKIPLNGKLVEIEISRRHEAIRSAHAERHYLCLEIRVAALEELPSNKLLEILVGNAIADLLTLFNVTNSEYAHAANVNA